ncbi:MAG: HD domain-containing protein [Acidimicrobiales bacterium]
MADPHDDLGAEAVGRVVEFVIGLDRLKGVERRTYVSDGSRRGEQRRAPLAPALMAMAPSPHAGVELEVDSVIPTLLIHDLTEIASGDTFRHDADYDERTQTEAAHLPGVLEPLNPRERDEIANLTSEFELGASAEARLRSRPRRAATVPTERCCRGQDMEGERRKRGSGAPVALGHWPGLPSARAPRGQGHRGGEQGRTPRSRGRCRFRDTSLRSQ